jgi:PiT family inorganic phosphate transporter
VLPLLVITVATALAFDYTNGFHDTANAMATTIATRALRPQTAVAMASALNLVGAFLSVTVAATIASGVVDQLRITVPVIFAGLAGAIVWNVITWYRGIPSSSSHALVGGMVGSVLAAEGTAGVIWSGVAAKVLVPALLAPIVCGVAALVATRVADRLTRPVGRDDARTSFRKSQILSSGLVALAHGTNDAQKTMGVIVLTLIAANRLPAGAGVPTWVKVTCAAAVALGTFSGGWRVIRTLGTKITHIEPEQGFSAETASSTTILASAFFGFSLSTTQIVSGGVIGAGLGRPGGVIDWKVVRRMALAWGATLPAAGLMGAAAELIVATAPSRTVGVIVVAAIAVAVVSAIGIRSRRDSVNAGNVLGETAADEPERPPAKSLVAA